MTQLQDTGLKVRLVSMPSVDIFETQDQAYQQEVLPIAVRKRLAVETSIADYWRKFVGLDGEIIGMTSFGESAPGPAVLEEFGFTPENIVKTVEEMCKN